MADIDTTSGVWLDIDTGDIVTTPPHRGRQLVAPGHQPTNAQQTFIDRYRADYADALRMQARVVVQTEDVATIGEPEPQLDAPAKAKAATKKS